MEPRRGAVRLAVPDLISPSYFPAIAAVELGCIAEHGVDAQLDLVFPVTAAAVALREGEIDFLAGAAHAPLSAFPDWQGAKLLMALSHNMYWFLVVRSDLDTSGGIHALRDVRIGAAPGPDLGLVRLLEDLGVDPRQSGIEIGPVPTEGESDISFGVVAARALAARRIDAFWANGMAAELAVRDGTGRVLLDSRRGDDPPQASSYTFPALATTDRMLDRQPDVVAAVVRGVVDGQRKLRKLPELAASVGARLFPPLEASLISELVERDVPFYDPEISERAVQEMGAFARRAGLLDSSPRYEQVVAVAFTGAWEPAAR